MTSPIIAFDRVFFRYGKEWVLKETSFSIRRGDCVGVVGPNGGGKTTLLRLALGLLTPSGGSILLEGHSPKESWRNVGYVPQKSAFDPHFPTTVEEVILSGRLGTTKKRRCYGRRDHEAKDRVLETVGLSALKNAPLTALSGGERQRVLIGRGLVGESKLLFLDEPMTNIDKRSEEDLYVLLRGLLGTLTIMIVSHDLRVIPSLCNRVLCVNQDVNAHDEGELVSFLSDYLHEKKKVHAHPHLKGEAG